MIAHPNTTDKLETVNNCIIALGHSRTSGKYQEALIKKYKINIVAEVRLGRGVARMMKREQMNELIAKHIKTTAKDKADQNDPQIHIFALEAKIDRQSDEILRIYKEMEILIKANNLIADRLNKVLSSLGCAS